MVMLCSKIGGSEGQDDGMSVEKLFSFKPLQLLFSLSLPLALTVESRRCLSKDGTAGRSRGEECSPSGEELLDRR